MEAFHAGEIGFLGIADIVERVLDEHARIGAAGGEPTLT